MRKFHLAVHFVILLSTTFAQVEFTSSSLPIFIITTGGKDIPSGDKITADLGVINHDKGLLNYVTDPFNEYSGKIGIEIRGHSSQGFPKKQYGMELRDGSGNSVNASLLGMPEESDWVLNASFTDKTFLRNVLAYRLGNEMGRYASRTQFFELVLNGEYMGLYVLQEKVKRDKARVNIKKLEAADISGDALTGGYIMKIDRIDAGDKYFNSYFPSVYPKIPSQPSPISYIHVYPNSAKIVQVQQDYIKNYVTQFEKALSRSTYLDPFLGYYDFVDMDALVDYFLVSEFVKTVDAYRLSAYFYKNRDSEGGKMVFGPMWDYDISFGLADYANAWMSSGWEAEINPYEGIWSSPFWVKKIFADPVFKNRFAKRWIELRQTVFNLTKIMTYIDQNVLNIKSARERNFIRWPMLGVYQWPEYFVGQTYEDEILYFKGWIIRRYNWMDAQLPAGYSSVTWNPVDTVVLNVTPTQSKHLPLSYFVSDVQNVSSFNFVSESGNLHFQVSGDSVFISVDQEGEYTFKIAGIYNNQNTVLSPVYKISTVTDAHEPGMQLNKFALLQNYPNPFNPSTTIEFSVPADMHVTLKIYNTLGMEIKTVVDGFKHAGEYTVRFEPGDLPSGIYFYKLVCGNNSQIKKMILMK